MLMRLVTHSEGVGKLACEKPLFTHGPAARGGETEGHFD